MSHGTLAERILAQAAGRPVTAGDVVVVRPDTVMVHDSIAPQVMRLLARDLDVRRVAHPERVAVVIDHVAPAANVATAEAQAALRGWVAQQGIQRFHDAGRGIAHQVLIEEHVARPGAIVVGTDSHSTAYGAVAGERSLMEEPRGGAGRVPGRIGGRRTVVFPGVVRGVRRPTGPWALGPRPKQGFVHEAALEK